MFQQKGRSMARRNYRKALTHASSHHVACALCLEPYQRRGFISKGYPLGLYQQAQIVHGAPLDPIVAAIKTIAVVQTTIKMADRRLTSLRRKSVGTRSFALGRVGLESLQSQHASAADNRDANLWSRN
jgi:hypothetical protein